MARFVLAFLALFVLVTCATAKGPPDGKPPVSPPIDPECFETIATCCVDVRNEEDAAICVECVLLAVDETCAQICEGLVGTGDSFTFRREEVVKDSARHMLKKSVSREQRKRDFDWDDFDLDAFLSDFEGCIASIEESTCLDAAGPCDYGEDECPSEEDIDICFTCLSENVEGCDFICEEVAIGAISVSR